MTESFPCVACDVVRCPGTATARYLDLRHGQELEFHLCAGHFEAIEGGVAPALVFDERSDVAKADARPALVMDPVQ